MRSGEVIDGRHERRQRTREAVVDAVFSLAAEGSVPPTVEEVATRAGISVSSVFRNFDGLADMQRRALDEFEPRFASLFRVDDADASQIVRIGSHVRDRVELHTAAGGLMRMARARAVDHDVLAEGTTRLRSRFAEQTRQRFAIELGQLSKVDGANLSALIDAATSAEAFDVMVAGHARTPRQITTTWMTALGAILSRWTPNNP